MSIDNDTAPAQSRPRFCGRPEWTSRYTAWVVYIGRRPGVYSSWPEVEEQVLRVRNFSHQAFRSRDAALLSYQCAVKGGFVWSTVERGDFPIPEVTMFRRLDSSCLQNCLRTTNSYLSRLAVEPGHQWHVVFVGLAPGVYRWQHEAFYYSTGIPHARRGTYKTREGAFGAFIEALERGEVGMFF
ncbi:hypothetical protein FB107DRAFT_280442 [Schizophyllum commune]